MSIYPLLGYKKADRSYETYRDVCAKRARFERRLRITGNIVLLGFILLALIPFFIVLFAEFAKP